MAVRRSLAWLALSQSSWVVLQFGSSVVLARLLTPFEMGVFSLGAATVGLLTVFQAFGFPLFVIREPELTKSMVATAFTLNAALSLLLSASMFLLSLAGGTFFHEAGVQHVMAVLALVPLIGAVEFLPNTRLERNAEFGAISIVNSARALVSCGTTVALAFAGWSFMSLAWGTVAGACTSAVLFLIVGREHVSFKLGLNDWRPMLRFGMQQLVIQGVNTSAARVSEIVLGRTLGLSALGLYGRASGLNNLVFNNLNLIVGRVVLVDFAAQRRAGLDLRDKYLHALCIMTALLWPALAGLAVLGGPFIYSVYGPAWLPAALPLSLLSIASILLVSITMTWEVFVVCNESGRQARLETIRTGAGLLFFIGGCFISVPAAAGSRIVEAFISVGLYGRQLERMTGAALSDFLAIYRQSALLTVAACSPVILLMASTGWSPATSLPLLVAGVLVGGLAWLGGLWAMDHPLLDEIRRLLSHIRIRTVPSRAVG